VGRPEAPAAPHDTAGNPATTFARALDALDRAGARTFERWRGRRAADASAAILSNLSDYGLVWVMVATVKARHRGTARRRAILTLGLAGTSSFALNRAVKHLVQRERPVVAALDAAADTLPVRRPTSTSFPSGHTLAAFTTAVALSEGSAQTAGALGFASAVAASRVHLGAHHTSDVVGGAAIGTLLGLAVRRVVDRSVPRR
jgi:membrane-associated phospholipid phosphatase